VLIIPATAVLYAPYGDSVFLVVDAKEQQQKDQKAAKAGKNGKETRGEQDKKESKKEQGAEKGGAKAATGLVLRQQFVRLGEKRGDFVAINSGLKQGETIVSTGVFKLRNGQAVLIDNKLAPTFQQAPKPENN
jgi:membrane fusion protein, multidrug efflux system